METVSRRSGLHKRDSYLVGMLFLCLALNERLIIGMLGREETESLGYKNRIIPLDSVEPILKSQQKIISYSTV